MWFYLPPLFLSHSGVLYLCVWCVCVPNLQKRTKMVADIKMYDIEIWETPSY